MKVLLDIDGVIADFYAGFAEYLNNKYGTKLDIYTEPSEYSIYNWGHGLPKDVIDKEIPRWIMWGGYENIPIYKGAREFVSKMEKLYDVYIVTARIGDFDVAFEEILREIIKDDTYGWLEHYKLPSTKLFFEHNKIDFCRDNGIGVIIEDKLSTALKGAQNGFKSILVHRQWNDKPERYLEDILIAYDYEDILNLLKE